MCRTYNIIYSDWGYMAAVWSEIGLWALSFPRTHEATAVKDLKLGNVILGEPDERSNELRQQLNIYFRGFQVEFDTPIDWSGYTPFQADVLKVTTDIAYGQTKSYREVAEIAGTPKAARAVGGALHINRTLIVVPCHRVVGTDGSLTGFGGGLNMKKVLLLLGKTLPC